MKKEIVRINGVLRRYSAVIAAGLLILQAGAASAEDLKTEQDSQDEYNLLKNGGFEMADELSPNYPKDWDYRHFVSDSAPLDWEFAKPGHESEQCLRIWSDKEGAHGIIYQNLKLEGGRNYKISAWIKADISANGQIVLLDCMGFGNAGTKKESFGWTRFEKTFQTPPKEIDLNASFQPVILTGPAEVWIDDVRLVDLGPAQLGKEVFFLPFNDPAPWKISAHVDAVPAEVPKEVELQSDSEHVCDGRPGLRLSYSFPSAGHDAIMMTTDVSIKDGKWLALRVYGDGSGHELDAVLYDKSGEAHYLPIGPVYWKGWKTVYKSFAALRNGPKNAIDVSCEHWDGDKNQKLDLPVTRISIGLNDKPDKFRGKGEISFGWMKIHE